jgi:hypothetical protein
MDYQALIDCRDAEVILHETGWLDDVSPKELERLHAQFSQHFENELAKLSALLGSPSFTRESRPDLAEEIYCEASRLAAWRRNNGISLLAYGQHDRESPVFVSFGFREENAA